jgi:hypothetical protein
MDLSVTFTGKLLRLTLGASVEHFGEAGTKK